MDAAHWYAVTDVGDGILRIEERHAAPLHAGLMWLIRGRDRDLLVDAGTGVFPLRPLVLGLTGREPVLLVTHAHYDHMGAAHEFGERWAHPAEADILGEGGRIRTLAEGWLGPASFLQLPQPGFDAARHEVAPAPPTRLVAGGDIIDVGARPLEIVHLPGHSPGLLGLFEAATGTLFSSDALYDGPMILDLPGGDRGAAARSLKQIAALQPRIVHPGHFASLGGTKAQALVARRLAALDGAGQTV
ncbi:MBL fold metallo-hydrolase [Alsobacter sp. R-9]